MVDHVGSPENHGHNTLETRQSKKKAQQQRTRFRLYSYLQIFYSCLLSFLYVRSLNLYVIIIIKCCVVLK